MFPFILFILSYRSNKYSLVQRNQDIALLKLDKDAKLKHEIIMPICLPLADDKSDVVKRKDDDLVLYTAGWGLTSANCMTDELGPIKSKLCEFPFEFEETVYESCSQSRSPSSREKVCKKLKRQLKSEYPKKPGEFIMLDTGAKNISCYAFKSGAAGWCKGPGVKGISADNNWGWCKSSCNLRPGTLRFCKTFAEKVAGNPITDPTKTSLQKADFNRQISILWKI